MPLCTAHYQGKIFLASVWRLQPAHHDKTSFRLTFPETGYELPCSLDNPEKNMSRAQSNFTRLIRKSCFNYHLISIDPRTLGEPLNLLRSLLLKGTLETHTYLVRRMRTAKTGGNQNPAFHGEGYHGAIEGSPTPSTHHQQSWLLPNRPSYRVKSPHGYEGPNSKSRVHEAREQRSSPRTISVNAPTNSLK